MTSRPRLLPTFLAACALLAGSGCSMILPEGRSDPVRFYVLTTPQPGEGAPRTDVPAIALRPVELANYLRGRPLIVRRGDNEIEFRDFARWGEPLDHGIARVLLEELIARGAARTPSMRRDGRPADFTLVVRVLACEGGPRGDVLFRAAWELTPADAKAGPGPRGEFRATDLRWDGKTESSLVTQLSAAVNGLAGEIATALKK